MPFLMSTLQSWQLHYSEQNFCWNVYQHAIPVDLNGDASLTSSGTITINNKVVTTVKILDANVTTAKIVDANVTEAKLADDAVTTVKILDANITRHDC